MKNTHSFTCDCCGKTYNEIPLCFGTRYPDFYFSIPPEERDKRVELTESLCVIDEKLFFHRGRITIKIIDYNRDLIFNVWTTISEQNFELRNDLWNSAARIFQEPYFGWLQTTIPNYEDTLNIKTLAFENEVGLIPNVKVIEDLHPLTIDQQNGIMFNDALVKVKHIMSKWPHD